MRPEGPKKCWDPPPPPKKILDQRASPLSQGLDSALLDVMFRVCVYVTWELVEFDLSRKDTQHILLTTVAPPLSDLVVVSYRLESCHLRLEPKRVSS